MDEMLGLPLLMPIGIAIYDDCWLLLEHLTLLIQPLEASYHQWH